MQRDPACVSARRSKLLDRALLLLAICTLCALSSLAANSSTVCGFAGIAVLAALCLEGWRRLNTLDAERRAVEALAIRAQTMTQGSLLRVVGAGDAVRALR